MKIKLNSITAAIIASFIIAVSLGGCAQVGRDARQPGQLGAPQQGENLMGADPNAPQGRGGMLGVDPGAGAGRDPADPNIGVNPGLGMTDQNLPDQQGGYDRQRAENIERQLVNMPEIQDANVVVNGNTALVGYRPANAGQDENVMNNLVTEKVRQIERTVTNVAATSSPEMIIRINRLETDIGQNRAIDNVDNEFNQLVQNVNNAGRQ